MYAEWPWEALMGTVSYIHAEKRTLYNTVYRQGRDEARSLFATSTLDQLRAARAGFNDKPGTLSIRQRAWQASHQDVLDDLIEAMVLAQAQ
jgi:hypothetical protein